MQLRKNKLDLSQVIELDLVQLQENIPFEMLVVRIQDRRIKQLEDKQSSLIKVMWNGQEKHHGNLSIRYVSFIDTCFEVRNFNGGGVVTPNLFLRQL